jgi:hypothetical protein
VRIDKHGLELQWLTRAAAGATKIVASQMVWVGRSEAR